MAIKENQLKKRLYLRQGQNRAIFENFFQLALLLEIASFFLLCLAIASFRMFSEKKSKHGNKGKRDYTCHRDKIALSLMCSSRAGSDGEG